MKNSKQRLFEVMSRLDKTFKPNLNEWNFDKKKDEDKNKDEDQEKDEKSEKEEKPEKEKDEKSETSEKEVEKGEELDESKPKIPVQYIAKVGK